MNKNLDKKIFKIISQQAKDLGVNAYVIGGYVRDCILGRDSKDIDIVVEGRGIELAEKVAEVIDKKLTVFRKFGTAMLRAEGGMEVEFVGARKESYRSDSRNPIVEDGTLEEDQRRRDFTINAMSFSLQSDNYGELTDPFNGLQDLQDRLIRTPLDPDTTYIDDPLRMIRAIRFATQLDFEIVPESLDSIIRNSERFSILSMERIMDEMHKIILAPKPSIGLLLLDKTGLLKYVLPELINLKGVENQEGLAHKDNFYHSLQVLDNIAPHTDDLWLRWAALLHDIGKAQTKKFEQGIGWTFHSHEFVGGKMVKKIFDRLSLPLDFRMEFVKKMVSLHLRPISLVEDVVTDSAVRRLLFDAGDDIDSLMLLCEADITSKNNNTVAKHKKNFQLVREKLVEVEEKDAIRNFKGPITGEMIMEIFGVAPCKEIGMLKEQIKNAILDGVIPNDYDSALALLKELALPMGLVELRAD